MKMNRYIVMMLIVFVAAVLSCGSASYAAEEKWVDLFDGKTLDGWIQRNGKAKYTVQDGMIVGETVRNTPNSFLCTEKHYRDFVLEVEFLVVEDMNSGIQIRSNSYADYKNYRVHGYQVEIDPSSRAWSAGIYDEGRRKWLFSLKDKPRAQKAFKQGQWNHYRIAAIGDSIRTWINGVPAADLVDDMTGNGFIALQVHGSKKAGQQIRWRNIRIKDLSGKGGRQLKTLIIDGQNNHDWKATTPVISDILDEAGLFTVDVATTPSSGKPMDSFRPNFSDYDVIVANYTGDEWPDATKEAFVKYMENGGGLVVVHAANNAFAKWKEWNEMIAIGGWGGRNEKDGPYVYWKDGKVIYDNSPGNGGRHGQKTDWLVTTRNYDHAITAGLPTEWMHVKDELYSMLRGPAKNMMILATGMQDTKYKATGRNEPVLFTVRYGKGRVFHTVMGHAVEQMRCVGFIVTLQRGTEWAATGRVTQIDVPADFPDTEMPSVRSVIKIDCSAVEEYDFGKSRAALAAIEEYIRSVSPAGFASIEAKLLNSLKSPKTTFAGKQFVCRMLQRIGSAQSVPVLSAMLSDKEMSHMARFALQLMPAPEAGDALLAAMDRNDGDLRIGLIGSLGQRGEQKATARIASFVTSSDKATAEAAIVALSRIGSAEAAKALAGVRVASELKSVMDDAQLMCADKMLAAGAGREAVSIYRSMIASGNSKWIRIAAYRGLIRAEKSRRPSMAVSRIIELLNSADVDMQKAGGKFVAEIRGEAATLVIAEKLGSLNSIGQVILLGALEDRGDKVAAPRITGLVTGGDESVRLAAIKALAILGDASTVRLLASSAAAGGGAGRAAQASLARLFGEGVNDAIVRIIGADGDATVRSAMIQAAIDRGANGAVAALLKAAADSDASVRKSAVKALGKLATADNMRPMVRMLLSARDSSERDHIERAIVMMVARLEGVSAEAVIAALPRADSEAKASLLAILSSIGGDDALAAVRGQVRNADANVKKAAVRSLADWSSLEPMDDLLQIAKSDANLANAVLAIRGYIKLLLVPINRSAAETVKLMADAMAATRRTEEKKTILGALSKFPCKESLALAERFESVSGIASEAKLAAGKIKTAMLNPKLNVTASINNGGAKKAIDGNKDTRWATGREMEPGDWFMIDVGIECQIRSVTLDAAGSSRGYPRGYKVYVSFDGGKWPEPVAVGKGTGPLTRIELDKPTRGRFIKIEQTGSAPGLLWSIHDVKVELE